MKKLFLLLPAFSFFTAQANVWEDIGENLDNAIKKAEVSKLEAAHPEEHKIAGHALMKLKNKAHELKMSVRDHIKTQLAAERACSALDKAMFHGKNARDIHDKVKHHLHMMLHGKPEEAYSHSHVIAKKLHQACIHARKAANHAKEAAKETSKASKSSNKLKRHISELATKPKIEPIF